MNDKMMLAQALLAAGVLASDVKDVVVDLFTRNYLNKYLVARKRGQQVRPQQQRQGQRQQQEWELQQQHQQQRQQQQAEARQERANLRNSSAYAAAASPAAAATAVDMSAHGGGGQELQVRCWLQQQASWLASDVALPVSWTRCVLGVYVRC
jgi:hypothetical protein